MATLLPCPDARRALRDLQQHVAGAQDGKLREIVALVDSLSQRGAADTLIAPLRARLNQLRPPRRVNLTRLFFVPADPVIVAPARWRRGRQAIPRSALLCLAALIRRELGAEASALAAAVEGVAVEGVASDDRGQILRHGRNIWPRAAAILESAPVPSEWAGMTGLTAPDFLAVARPLAVVLGEAVAIEHMVLLGAAGDDLASQLHACLARAQARVARMEASHDAPLAGLCLGMLLAVLLARLPSAEPLLVASADFAARSGDPVSRLVADSAVDAMFDQAEARLAQPGGGGIAIGELSRVAGLIEAVEQPGPAGRPSRKPRAQALRRALDQHCRQRFQSDLAERLLMQMPQLGAATPDAQVGELEEIALDLRRLESVGRAFGSAAHYDRALAEGGQALLKLARPDARRVDLARLAEILLGPEAGLAVLDAAAS